jgi:hypothetical protein
LVYLINMGSYRFINKKTGNKWLKFSGKLMSFIFLYCLFTFAVVPPLARQTGRNALPFFHTGVLKPLTIWTCILNRHYVRPKLLQAISETADELEESFPGSYINYLDAGFPFFYGFPLFTHLCNNHGRQQDLSFCYNHATGNEKKEYPSPFGYGVYEAARPNEKNMSDECKKKGYWQYDLLNEYIPSESKKQYQLNQSKTMFMLKILATKPIIEKIFIEPHLKTRLGLTSSKIRFQGCHSVRHDDHIHIQIK